MVLIQSIWVKVHVNAKIQLYKQVCVDSPGKVVNHTNRNCELTTTELPELKISIL